MLADYLDDVAGRRFVYGNLDCCTFMADWLIRCGWPDPMADRRGKYDASSWQSLLDEEGGLVESCSTRFASIGMSETSTPTSGDVAVIMAPHPTGAICANDGFRALPAKGGGLTFVKAPVVKAWTFKQPVEWQPISGCFYASRGCANCKTMKLAPESMRREFIKDGLVKVGASGSASWSGNVTLSEERFGLPKTTTEPTEFVVCPHGDLFHESVPDDWILRVFDEIKNCKSHGFQIHTKRASRMRSFFEKHELQTTANISLGVSCEGQREVDDRVPHLRKTPCSIRTITLYPLLESVDLSAELACGGIHFVIAGEEKERPANPIWFESLREQCAKFDTPFRLSSKLVGDR